MPTPQQARENAVTEARTLSTIGAHYLTNTFGAVPGEADRITGRRLSYISHDFQWRSLAIRTAEFGGLRCCGRYVAAGGRRIHAPMTANPPDSLQRWIQQVQTHPEWDYVNNPRMSTSRAPAFENHFWPRRHSTTNSYKDYVYIGESCAGKMHFDCVGFVCYVFTRATGKRFWVGLRNFDNRGTIIPVNTVSPGDIILSNTHVALVESKDRSNIWLIHANGDQRGVERTAFDRSASTWRSNLRAVRIHDRFL